MQIDLIVGILAVLAAIWGYRRGLILAVFSFVATILGVLIAFKCSSLVAGWLGERTSLSVRWLPTVSFLLILIGVILLVQLGAKALEGMLELAQLGLLNRLAGSLLYLLLMLAASAILYQVGVWGGLLNADHGTGSYFATHIQLPVMNGLRQMSQWLPGFKDMFQQLENFFDKMPT